MGIIIAWLGQNDNNKYFFGACGFVLCYMVGVIYPMRDSDTCDKWPFYYTFFYLSLSVIICERVMGFPKRSKPLSHNDDKSI